VLVLALLPVASCASIPETSDPRVVKQVDEGNASIPAPTPPRGMDPIALVRNFVDSAAAPENDYAAARMRMTGTAKREWKAPPGLLIVDDVDTIPVPSPPGTPANVQLVSLQVDKVGRLKPDQSFVPLEGAFETQVRVERQADGEWRIATPPPELVVSRKSFTDNYMPTPIYFLDSDRNGVVPDLRYALSAPNSTRPARVINLLNSGPSEGLRGAMASALPEGARTNTNVSEDGDGALVVDFKNLGFLDPETRRLVAAQVVLSLQSVSSARVRLQMDGTSLLPDKQEWRPADVARYERDNEPRPDVPGMAVVDERLHYLDESARPVKGPAGSGAYNVVRAAQSGDGSQVAAAVRRPTGGVSLRVGDPGGELSELPVSGIDMTRPRFRSRDEVWTVVDGRTIVRAVREDGAWIQQPVNAVELAQGAPIKDFRLSRDGTRAAAIVRDKVVVAGVVVQNGQAVLQRPTVLTGGPRAAITGLEWVSDRSLVLTTDSNVVPVTEVSFDGLNWTDYTSSNLGQPLTSITVGPNRRVVVADRTGLWQASGSEALWQPLQVPIGGGSIPFYAG
jgi:hypothetical protein